METYTRADVKLNKAIKAIYQLYGNNLAAFFEDARRSALERANGLDVSAEHARLEREVIAAAKRCRQNDLAITHYWERRASDTWYDPDSAELFTLINNSGGKAFSAVVDALIELESTHGIETKD